MIKEICQFVETLEEQAPDLFEEGAKLKEGIYVALDIALEDGKYVLKNVDENGNILNEDIGLFTKKEELTPFFEKCRKVLQLSNPVDKNKMRACFRFLKYHLPSIWSGTVQPWYSDCCQQNH